MSKVSTSIILDKRIPLKDNTFNGSKFIIQQNMRYLKKTLTKHNLKSHALTLKN